MKIQEMFRDDINRPIILVAYCKDLEIEVPENMVTRIYVCGKSEVRIECKGKCDIIEYGEDNDVKIIGYDDANMTLGKIYVSEWNSCNQGTRCSSLHYKQIRTEKL